MDQRSLGLLVVALGIIAVIVGLLISAGALSWVGRLPGDLRWEGQRTRVYVPIASMIVISVVLTILLNVLRR